MSGNRIHIDWKRRLLARGLAVPIWWAARLLPKKKTDAPFDQVILVEPFGMGDIVNLVPLVKQLRQRQIRVILVAQARWQPLFESGSVEWWPVPDSWDRLFRWPLTQLISFVRELRQRFRQESPSGDWIGLDPRGDIRSIFFLRLLGVKRIFSLDHYLGTDLKLPTVAYLLPDISPQEIRWKTNLGFSRYLFREEGRESPPGLGHFKNLPPVIPGRIGIVSVAPWAGKLWEPAKWTQVIERGLGSDRSRSFQLICGPGQAAAARASVGGQGIPIEEAADVQSLVHSLARCELVITIDSGPMHLASALKKPLVALFGCTQLPLWAPFSPLQRVLCKQSLFAEGAVHQISRNIELGKAMMNAISVDEVMVALEDLSVEVQKNERTSCI